MIPVRLLLVDDDPSVRRALGGTLSEGGYEVAAAEDAEQALARMADFSPEVILSDIRMPGLDGIELLKKVRERAPSVDVILMTAYDDMPTVVRAMREGAFDFLVKPLDPEELESVLDRAEADHRIREQAERAANEEAKAYRLDTLVGHDPRMIEVYKLVGQLAASRVTVLIRGETGTGKELVARAIHHNSPDHAKPFIPINCSALPENLLESELFGHVKGAFTGAVADRRGRFALAGRGTVFLDEIGDTTPAFQSKLLRVLEDGEFYPVGADQPATTEARVIAATHRALERMVEEGRFREDLYYRLQVVEIRLPPLRERPSDIPILAQHFVQKASRELHCTEPTLPEESLNALLQHDWPGNVRELENCLTRAVVTATGTVIRPGHLRLGSQDRGSGDAGEAFQTLEDLSHIHVRRVMAATEGNKTEAARILGISKPKLYRMLEAIGRGKV